MKEQWNQRYNSDAYFYGEAPNAFFKSELQKLKPGKILLPMEGEGRNAVYAATLGWEVFAYDFSEIGQQKAIALAKKYKVNISFEIIGNEVFECNSVQFDALGLIFAHLPIEQRETIFSKWTNCLKPGAEIIMEVYSKKQLALGTGGPPVLNLLYSQEELQSEFSMLSHLNMEQKLVEISEGDGHNGMSSVIRVRGQV